MLLFSSGPIHTMQADREPVEAVVVANGRIVAVGGRDLGNAHPTAERVDLAGRSLVPGFIDAHNHLSQSALHPRFADATNVKNLDDLAEVVRHHVRANPGDGWIRICGWDESKWGFAVDRDLLDGVTGTRPAVLAHYSLHQCVANSAALDDLGIGERTPDPMGGEIGRRADGQPDGMLIERAWSHAFERSLAPYCDPDRWAEHIAARAHELAAEGITAIHDAACAPAAEDVYRTMAADRTLPISVLVMPHSAALLNNDLGGRLDGAPTGEGDEWLRVGPAKFFADGGVAIALDTSIGGSPVRHGYVMADLETHASAATTRGFRIAIHAIGNRGVEFALDTIEHITRRAGDTDHRARIEHATVTGPSDWVRMAELGVVAVVQPGFVEHVGIQSQGVHFDDHHWLAFAGMAEAGVTLAGSSDDPCAPSAPLWGIAKGVSRSTSTGIAFEPDQSLPFDDWLRAYTIDAARAGGQEDERGSIATGKRADLVLLDLTDSPRVCATYVAGSRVFSDEPGNTAGAA